MSYSINETFSATGCLGIMLREKDIPAVEVTLSCGHTKVTQDNDCPTCGKRYIWPDDFRCNKLRQRIKEANYEFQIFDGEWYIGKILGEGHHDLPEIETFINTVSDIFTEIPHEKGLFIYLDQEDY